LFLKGWDRIEESSAGLKCLWQRAGRALTFAMRVSSLMKRGHVLPGSINALLRGLWHFGNGKDIREGIEVFIIGPNSTEAMIEARG
jgi:hypothetical protein